MKKYQIDVERVTGYCSHAYKPGDRFIFDGLDTPGGFCGGAYTTLFPILVALGSGARSGSRTTHSARRAWPAPTTDMSSFR